MVVFKMTKKHIFYCWIHIKMWAKPIIVGWIPRFKKKKTSLSQRYSILLKYVIFYTNYWNFKIDTFHTELHIFLLTKLERSVIDHDDSTVWVNVRSSRFHLWSGIQPYLKWSKFYNSQVNIFFSRKCCVNTQWSEDKTLRSMSFDKVFSSLLSEFFLFDSLILWIQVHEDIL